MTDESCEQIQASMLDGHYGECGAQERAAVTAHIARCGQCARAAREWKQVSLLLSAPDVAAELAPGAIRAGVAAWVPPVLGGLAALVSLAPALGLSGGSRIGTATLTLTALIWTLAYQTLFAGLLAEHRHRRLPVDMGTILLGLLACEGALVLAAGLVLSAPLLQWPLAIAVRLSLPGLITALSGSIVLAVSAFLGMRGQAKPFLNAACIALLHALLMVPSQMLIGRDAGHPAEWLGSVAFLVACAALGCALGSAGAAAERMRAAGEGWHAQTA